MKTVKLFLLCVLCLLISVISSYASEESLTITTYYPSPYGSYRELRSQRIAIGENYISGSAYCWEGETDCISGGGKNVIPSATDLVVGGNVGIGTASPTAILHLKAGTATANTAPLKLTSGTNLTTPEAGAIEYDGNHLYFTGSGERINLTNKPTFSVHNNGVGQNIPYQTWTKLTWSTEEWDTNNNFVAGKFTPTIAGKYLLTASLQYEPVVVNLVSHIAIYKNGSLYKYSLAVSPSPTTYQPAVDISVLVDANGTTDYFEVYTRQNDNTIRTISGSPEILYFQGYKIN